MPRTQRNNYSPSRWLQARTLLETWRLIHDASVEIRSIDNHLCRTLESSARAQHKTYMHACTRNLRLRDSILPRLTVIMVSASSVDPPVTLASSSKLSLEAARTRVENTFGVLRSEDEKFFTIALRNCGGQGSSRNGARRHQGGGRHKKKKKKKMTVFCTGYSSKGCLRAS